MSIPVHRSIACWHNICAAVLYEIETDSTQIDLFAILYIVTGCTVCVNNREYQESSANHTNTELSAAGRNVFAGDCIGLGERQGHILADFAVNAINAYPFNNICARILDFNVSESAVGESNNGRKNETNKSLAQKGVGHRK